jgi:hypothetical protein
VLTVHQLVAADPAATSRAAEAWRRLAVQLGGPTAELDRQLDTLRLAWAGTAAEAAIRQLVALCTELDDAYPTLRGIEQTLAEHAATVARAQLIAVTARAHDNADTAELDRALALARGSDAESAVRLAGLAPVGASASPVRVPAQRDPAGVSMWWDELSGGQRRWLIEHRPELVGNLDGIPATDRDRANRVSLTAALSDPDARHRAALQAIQARLDPGTYLLGLSTDGRGRAIVAVGDPDTADHVVTCIPGLGGNLDRVTDELTRIGHLSTAARQAAPDRSTSVIAWLGYDAPENLAEATSTLRARNAAPDLHRFQTGLRYTHHGGAAHHTVIGMSYGSTVVGLTGHGDGLVSDDAVLIGSPGAGVYHAGDLGLDPTHVWASTARHDVINAAADHPGLGPLLRPVLGLASDRGWFGPSPASTNFGAHGFTSSPGRATDPVGAHQGYYDEGNQALSNMADIVVGDFAAVT